MDRRELLQVGLTVLAGAVGVSEAEGAGSWTDAFQTRPGSQGRPLGAFPLGAAFEGWQGTMTEVTYPPGAESAAHQHPGPTFGYVLSGKIRWAINGEPAKILEAGQTFFEPMGSVHSTSANASETEPARLLAVILGKNGEPLSKPAPRPGD